MIIALFFASEVLAENFWYVAPEKGGPSVRVDVQHRGLCASVPNLPRHFKLEVIAPERLAYTIKAQPTMYWRVNNKVTGTFALTIEEMGSGFSFNEPLVDKFFELTANPDELQKISLAQLGVRLKKGVDYKWTLALVCDKRMRSTDLGQTGGIRYVNKPAGVSSKALKELARHGVWYDVFNWVSEAERQHLLKQIGL